MSSFPSLRPFWTLFLASMAPAFFAAGCNRTPAADSSTADEPLVGAWRAKIQFTSGAYAAVKDLEFMYVFNSGGTMTESSNYDSSPPVPPAYGSWRKTGPRQYEAKYEFFVTKPPAGFDDIAKGNGWSPAGHGMLVEKITLSTDGRTFQSTIKFDAFDLQGKATETGSEARTEARRIGF